MVNVTYDACKSLTSCHASLTDGILAGSLVAYTPDGEEVVYNLGDMGFVIASMALVWLMVPGVGLFYSGLLRRKNALSMIYTSLASIAVVSFQVRIFVS